MSIMSRRAGSDKLISDAAESPLQIGLFVISIPATEEAPFENGHLPTSGVGKALSGVGAE